MKRRILVTGGAGFIGSFLVDELVQKGHDVTILDNLTKQVHSGKPEYLNSGAAFVKGDVCDYELLKKHVVDSDIIFHDAASVGISQSNYRIKEFVNSNLSGTANLLDILVNHDHDVKKIILPGSNTSYGEGLYSCFDCGIFHPSIRTDKDIEKYGWEPVCPKCKKSGKAIPTSEDTTLDCNSIYAQTKRNQEDMLRLVGKMYGIPTTILRCFNVFGPRQSLNNPYTGVTAIFMSRIKSGNKPVIYEDGFQTRDFIPVREVIKANIMAMENKAADNQVFNVGSGKPVSIQELVKILANLYGKSIKSEPTKKFRKGDIRHCIADISKIKKKLEFEPKISFIEGIKELIEWSKIQESVDKFDQSAQELRDKNLI